MKRLLLICGAGLIATLIFPDPVDVASKPRSSASARTSYYVIVIASGFVGTAGEMLIDHRSDPLELKNLAGDLAYAGTVRVMKQLLAGLPMTPEQKP